MHATYAELSRNMIIVALVGGSIILHLGALVAGGFLFKNAKSNAKRAGATAIILFGIPGFFLNPVLNLLISFPLEERWYQNVAAYTGQPADNLVEYIGEPKHIYRHADGSERWYYTPGPWFMMVHFDGDVAVTITNGTVTDAHFTGD